MAEFHKDMWVYGIWFCGGCVNGKNQDWMCTLFKQNGGGWELEWRFRYHEDDEAFSSNDRKSWYEAKSTDGSDDSRDTAIAAINSVLKMIERQYGNKHEFLLLDCPGDDPKIFFEIGSMSWANVKTLSKEKAISDGYLPHDGTDGKHGDPTAPEGPSSP